MMARFRLAARILGMILLCSLMTSMVQAKPLTWQDYYAQGSQETHKDGIPNAHTNRDYHQVIRSLTHQLSQRVVDQSMVQTLMEMADYYGCGRPNYNAQKEALVLAVHMQEMLSGPSNPLIVEPLRQLSWQYIYRHDWKQAIALNRRIEHILEAQYGADSLKAVKGKEELAGILQAAKNYAEAEQMYRDILAIKDAEHSPTKVFIFQDLGDLYLEQNKLDLAQQYYQKALDMKTDPEVEALDKYWLSASLYGLAIIAHEKMQYAEARQWYAQALHELNPLNGPYRAQNIVTNIERATDWKKPVPEKQYRAY